MRRVVLADSSGGLFQLRPHKDFLPVKGRERVLSLRLLAELPSHHLEGERSSSPDHNSEPTSAYDFMRKRKDVTGDPTMQRWNASIRLANYAAVDSAPLCVSAFLDLSQSCSFPQNPRWAQ